MCAAENQDPLAEFQRENEVIERLLERLEEISLLLQGGTDIAPGEIAEGLQVLDRYLAVHSSRLIRDLQPEARLVAMPTCYEHLDRVIHNHAESVRRSADVLRALTEYEASAPDARSRLAASLERLASEDHEAVVYEGDYPLSCLLGTLPEDAAGRVGEKLQATRSELQDAETHLEDFLRARPGEAGPSLQVRCAHSACTATSTARVVSADGGKLGLRAPAGGWSISPMSPRTERDGVIRVRVEFFCPDHTSRENSRKEQPEGWSSSPSREGYSYD